MRYVELFAGVGGFRLGIERAFYSWTGETPPRDGEATTFKPRLESAEEGVLSMQLSPDALRTRGSGPLPYCVMANEWDKYSAQTYNKNFGGRIDQRDITTIPTEQFPDHDLLVGGFPCQAFSVAGKRGGFDDTRGTMFFEIARILADKKPQHLLLENVKGLLSHDSGRTFTTILGVLTDLGYNVEWSVLNSKNFGVPQNRERVLIVGHLGTCCGREVFPIRQDDGIRVGEDATYPGVAGGSAGVIDHGDFRYTEDKANALDANYHKGADNHGQRTLMQISESATRQAERLYDPRGMSVQLSSLGGGLGAKTGLYAIKTQPKYADGERDVKYVEENDNIPTIRATQHKHGDNETLIATQQPFVALTEARTEEAKAIRRESQKDGKDFSPRRGKMLVPRTDDVANTVTVAVGNERFMTDMTRIRRLTPLECERLQGFPDNWTLGVSDTQRYKQMGNAVTTNVIQAVITKLYRP